MIEINIQKDTDTGGTGKSFPLENADIKILHDTTDGKDIVRVTINGIVEFEYDVKNPDREIVGYFTSWEELTKGLSKEEIKNIVV